MEDNNIYYYAQLNEENICVVVGRFSNEINDERAIQLDEADTSLLGRRYENGVWSVVEKEEEEAVVSDEEVIRAELLLNQMTILENQNSQDEVLAEILLNQVVAEEAQKEA